MANTPAASLSMIGGDGPCSYAHNSSFQRSVGESAKDLIKEAILEKLDMKQLITSSSNLLNIADLGCSVGPNTFIAMQNIMKSLKLKCQYQDLDPEAIEFHVFFNDNASNDFNMLFKNLPCYRQYFAAGVPGSFHSRLFPKSSLHFVYSSYSLHWLSRAPKQLVDQESPALNKGRIYYNGAPREDFEAYSAQFADDMGSFLNARSEELFCGGLMALIIPCYPVGTPHSEFPLNVVIDLLGVTLMEMANMGLVSEDKVDSFNFPRYNPTPQELRTLIELNGYFSIEKMEPLVRGPINETGSSSPNRIHHFRAAWEMIIKEHFGSEIIDEVFDRFNKKVMDTPILAKWTNKSFGELLVVLKRKVT